MVVENMRILCLKLNFNFHGVSEKYFVGKGVKKISILSIVLSGHGATRRRNYTVFHFRFETVLFSSYCFSFYRKE